MADARGAGGRGDDAPAEAEGGVPPRAHDRPPAPVERHRSDAGPIPGALDRHVVLVGLPGSGKSSVGRQLAQALGCRFADLDLVIEERAGRPIPEIFAAEGEDGFRTLEAALSAELAREAPLVLAPGGGWMANEAAVAPLRPLGRIIYLRVTPETAIRRMGAGHTRRPLLAGPDPLDALRTLLDRRAGLYARADVEVDTEHLTLQQVTSTVAALVAGGAGPGGLA